MKLVDVRAHRRKTVRGMIPIHFHLKRLRDMSPEFQRFVANEKVTAYIDPDVDPNEVNIITNRYGTYEVPIEQTLSHETLHSVLNGIGETYAAGTLDNVVAGNHSDLSGFNPKRIPEGVMTRHFQLALGQYKRRPKTPSRF